MGVQEVWGRTHLCTALEESGAGLDPWVSFTVCLGVVWGGWGEVGGSGEVVPRGAVRRVWERAASHLCGYLLPHGTTPRSPWTDSLRCRTISLLLLACRLSETWVDPALRGERGVCANVPFLFRSCVACGSLVYNTPLPRALHGPPGLLLHSVMSSGTPLYMRANTVVDMSVDSAATEVEYAGDGERTQAHDGNPGALSSMDMSMTHEGAMDLAGELARALSKAEAVEEEVVALRAVVAALRVELVQALEGKDLAVEVFREQMDEHRLKFQTAWVARKAANNTFLEVWVEKKLAEVAAAQTAMGVAQAERDGMAKKCVTLEGKLGKREDEVGQLEEEGRRLRAALALPLRAPPCAVCLEPLLECLAAFPCGHVLHVGCARAVETSSRPQCTECPQPVTRRDTLRLFFSPSLVVPAGGGGSRDGSSTRASRC